MLVEDRREKIIKLLEENNTITLNELKKVFSVSESTLRNDLRFLEECKLLKRAHGGAMRLPNLSEVQEVSFQQRSQSNQTEKERIGSAAVKFINPQDTIILDAGTTVMELAKKLPSNFEFNVVTSALNTAMAASVNSNVSVHLVGGLLRHQLHELVGPKAIEGIREISAQTLFLGASGLDFERGITENHIFSAEIKKAMVDSAEKVILLLDSSKIGKSCFVDLAPLSRIDVLITDKSIHDKYMNDLVKKGIKVIAV